MPAPIIIDTELKPIKVDRQFSEVQRQANSAFGQIAAEAKKAGEAIDKATRETLRLAQAQARLQTAKGDLVGASRTLQTALAGVNQQTTQTIGAQTQLVRVQQQAAKAAATQRAESSLLSGALGGLGATLLGPAGIVAGLTALGAGLVQAVRETAEFGARVADMSQKTGLGVETISALDVILRETNSSIDSFSRSMDFFSRQLGQAQSGNKELAQTFKQLGIDVNQTSEGALRQVIQRYGQLETEAQKSAFAQKVFGKSGADLILTLNELDGDLDGTIRKMRELGLTVTPQAADAAKQLDDQLEQLGRQWQAIKLGIGSVAIPALSGLITIAQNVAGAFSDANRSLSDHIELAGAIAFGDFTRAAVVSLPRTAQGELPDSLEEAANAARQQRTADRLFDKPEKAKQQLTDLQRVNLEIEETIKKTNQLSDANNALFKSTVALKVERLELARAEEQAQLAFEKSVGIVRLPEIKDREPRLLDVGQVQQAKDTLKEIPKVMRDINEAIPPIPPQLSEMERFMIGFKDATFTAADAFEEFGRSAADALLSGRDALGQLGRAVKQFFSDLVGSALQATVRSALGSIFGGGGGGGGAGGIFGALGNIFGGGGGIGVPSAASGRTPPFAGFSSLFGGGSAATVGGVSIPGLGLPGASSIGPGAGGGFFSSLSTGGALPLLGIGLGSSLGGSSGLGNVLGGIGGGLLGIGLTAAPTSGALAGLAPLFSNPITAIIGGGLLVGSIFLGKAKQRKKDEEASGEFIGAANQGINDLIVAIREDRVVGLDQARALFEQQVILPFQQQISQLKTKSVRESRLTNTVRDLKASFEKHIPPEIEQQLQRQQRIEEEQERLRRNAERFNRQIPEFARGGIVPGIDRGFDSVMALARPGEMFLTRGQQSAIRAMAGSDVFSRAGVPGAGQQVGSAQAFANGGTVQRVSGRDSDEPIEISLNVTVGMSSTGAEEIAITGMSTNNGRRLIINHLNTARIGREL
jgi:hypothetical protein